MCPSSFGFVGRLSPRDVPIVNPRHVNFGGSELVSAKKKRFKTAGFVKGQSSVLYRLPEIIEIVFDVTKIPICVAHVGRQ